jgi:anti-sigma factor RsiW
VDKRPEFNDELLSAYLDDQLSPGERANVESRLAHDAEARELVRELQAAADAVRDLPKVAAPRDLKAAILRAAVHVDALESDDGSPTIAPAAGSGLSIGRTRRGWFWAALAVAAALLIMFVNQGDEPGRDVALHNEDGRDAALTSEPRIAARATDSSAIDDNRSLEAVESLERPDEGSLAAPQNLARDLADSGIGGREADSLDKLAAGGTELRSNLADQVAQGGESVAAEGVRSKEADGITMAQAANGQIASNVRYFKQLEQNAAANKNLSVVLTGAEAAFGEPVEVIQTDVPVYFVSVNVTPEAARNNFVLNSLGRNSIALVDEAGANLPGLAQPVAEAAVTLREEQLDESRTREQRAEPAAPAQEPASASGVIAVEAPPEQVAAFLNDIASDRQNVTALAVLAEAKAATAETGPPPSNTLDAAANYSRNAEDAIEQVAGNWRFETPGEAGKSVRLERVWSAPTVGAQLAQNDFRAFGGANGGERRQRSAEGPQTGAGLGGAGGYGGGFGSGAGGVPAAGYGRGGGVADQEAARTEVADEDAAPADEKAPAPDAAADARAAVQPDADSYRGAGRGVANTLAEQSPPQEPAAATTFGIGELARGNDDNTWADVGDKKLLGRAWIVSPLQVRSVTIGDQSQEQAQQHFNYAPLASEPAGTPPAQEAGQAPGSTDSQLRDRFDAEEVEGVRLQSRGATRQDLESRETETKDRSVKAETVEQLGDRPATERSLTLGAATEQPPPGAPAIDSAPQGSAAPAPQSQSAIRKEQAQTELFSAKSAAPATPQKPVRVVLFFNVLPDGTQSAAASAARPVAPQPAGAENESE